jgi:RimJ/RimL family protein N-acetyltransferase
MDKAVRLVSVTDDHKLLLFIWRNRPDIIALSGSGSSVNKDEHNRWFDGQLKNNKFFYIIEYNCNNVGHIRFDENNTNVDVTIYLVGDFTGKGVGSRALSLGVERILNSTEFSIINAVIRCDNFNSINFFIKNNFIFYKDLDSKFKQFKLTLK